MVLSAKVKRPGKVKELQHPGAVTRRRKLKFNLNGPALILLITLGFIFYSFGGQVVEMYNVQTEIRKIQTQMDDLKTKNQDLKRQVEELSSNAYIEREAREKLGLVKPGEKIILEAKPGAKGQVIPSPAKKIENADVH